MAKNISMLNKIYREETRKFDAFAKNKAEEDKVKRDLQKAKEDIAAITAKLQEIVKKINEDQRQEEYKKKIKAQLVVHDNVLLSIQG